MGNQIGRLTYAVGPVLAASSLLALLIVGVILWPLVTLSTLFAVFLGGCVVGVAKPVRFYVQDRLREYDSLD